MRRYTHLFWDWNGTLLDDVTLCVQTINLMLERRGLQKLNTLEDYRRVFQFPVEEYYKRVGFDFEKESFSVLAHEYMSLYQPESLSCDLHKGVNWVLETVWRRDVIQILLSASERNNLMAQVTQYTIESFFQHILGISDVFAKSKLLVAQDWMSNQEVDPGLVLFIGDTVHDFEVAQAIGCSCVLFSGGHQDKERLAACGCPVADSMEEILNFAV